MLLVLDNYDSFTWNLVQLLGELGAEPVVRRNDEVAVEELVARPPDRFLVSPGPCTPAEAGVSVEAIRALTPLGIPILGVCLGHQALGEAFGGRTIRAARLMHGKVGAIEHTGEGLFAGLPSPFQVTRYHSLVTDPDALPDVLEAVAWSAGPDVGGAREIQAMRHREAPVWGVQFHPESLFSEQGRELLGAFLRLPARV
jgi:anthranilate synthase/aminodeoxychorismate synthase-like glutamine amidotransferase